jgi:WD40 repeat protein
VARVWRVDTGKQISFFTGHPNWIWSAAFSPDSRFVVTAGSVGATARVWEAKSGKEQMILRGHKGFVSSAVFSPNGRYVLTASDDETARVWELNIGRSVENFHLESYEKIMDPDPSIQQKLRQISTDWNKAVYSDDRKFSVTFSDQEQSYVEPKIWQINTEDPILLRKLPEQKDGILAAAVSKDNKFVALAEYGNTARVWEISTDDNDNVFLDGHEKFIRYITFSPDSACVVTASEDGIIRIWQTTTGEPLEILHAPEERIAMIAFDPSGKFITTRANNNLMRIYSSAGCASTNDIQALAKSYIK